jgi:hypothetical protein
VGVTEKIAFKFTPGFVEKRNRGQTSVLFEDLPIQFDFQLYRENPNNHSPSVKLLIGETLPTGQYQKLDSTKLGTDSSGGGSFQSFLGIIFGRAYPISGMHYFRYRINPTYIYSAPVHVRGFNTYGGATNTAGKVYPGHTFRLLVGLEYSLTQRWTLALDLRAVYQSKTTFSGQKGLTSTGRVASIGGPANTNYSMAPAIEYNFNKKMGLVAGPWLSVAGKNSSEFLTWAIAFNYYN